MRIAAAVFAVFGVAFGAWCIVVLIDHGPLVGIAGMAVLSAALCHQATRLYQGRKYARRTGMIGAAALALASGVSAALVALPWLSNETGAAIPEAVRPALALLIASAAAFALAAAALVRDLRARPEHGTQLTRDR